MYALHYFLLILLYCVIQNQCCTQVTFVGAVIKVARKNNGFNLQERFTAKITGCVTPEMLSEQLGDMIITVIECFNQSVPILYEGAISNLPELNYITISDSKVRKIKQKPFHNVPNLSSLTLSKNEIEFIDKNAFANLDKLHSINLGENKIAFLEPGIFSSQTNLRYVYLHGNELEVFEPEWFPEDSKLHTIDVSNNYIRSIHKSTFKQFKSLKVLDLNSNKIQFIDKSAFDNLEGLGTLYLYNNRLRRLEPDLFKSLKIVDSIWINRNNLTYMPDKILADLISPNLFQLSLHTNPWQCACYNKIAAWASKRKVYIVTGVECYNDNNPVCLYPNENEDLCLENIEEDLNKIFYDSYVVRDHECV